MASPKAPQDHKPPAKKAGVKAAAKKAGVKAAAKKAGVKAAAKSNGRTTPKRTAEFDSAQAEAAGIPMAFILDGVEFDVVSDPPQVAINMTRAGSAASSYDFVRAVVVDPEALDAHIAEHRTPRSTIKDVMLWLYAQYFGASPGKS